MRKFKIKNRPKRKYTRRGESLGFSNLYKSTAINLLPVIFIIVASFGTFFLIQSRVSLRQFSGLKFSLPTLPSISYQTRNKDLLNKKFTYNLENVFTQYIKPINNTYSTTLNNLAGINLQIPQSYIAQELNDISATSQVMTSVVTQSINVFIFALRATTILLLTDTSYTISATINISTSTNAIIITFTRTFFFILERFFLNLLISIYKGELLILSTLNYINLKLLNIVVSIMISTKNTFIGIFTTIYKAILNLILIYKLGFIILVSKTTSGLEFTGENIMYSWQELLYALEYPFIELTKQLDPIFAYTGHSNKIIQKSTSDLISTANIVFPYLFKQFKITLLLTTRIKI